MSDEMQFFIYLLENYASYKNMSATEVLLQWDKLNLTKFIYNMYERYHTEKIENAYFDIDKLINERKDGL